MNRLFNDFEVTGTSEEKMFQELKNISDITEMITIEPYRLSVVSLKNTIKGGYKTIEFRPDEMYIDTLCSNDFWKEFTNEVSFEDFHRSGIDNNLISEISETSYFLKYDDKVIVPAPSLQNMLTHQLGAGKLYKEADPMNQLYLAYLLRESEPFSMIIRQVNNVAKGFAVFSENHTLIRQDERVREAINTIREQHRYTEISHFSIRHLKTEIELILPDLKVARKSNEKKYVIAPTFIISLADTGDYSYTIQPALSINGRAIRIGEAILFDKDNIKELISEELVNFNKIMSELEEGKAFVKKVENIRRIMTKLGYNKLGNKYLDLYNEYLKGFENEKCNKVEVMIEILTIPQNIVYLHTKTYNALPPEYVIEKMSRLSGNIFGLDFDRECF